MVSCFPCSIRLVEDRDFEVLKKIYLRHEGIEFPAGYFGEFKSAIRDEESIYLTAEVEGRVVGGGGMSNFFGGQSTLMFGIVDPDYCRQGIGTSLLLTRIQFLANCSEKCRIMLQATERSSAFFEKLGFKWVEKEIDENGHTFLFGVNDVKSPDRPIFLKHLNSGNVEISSEFLESPQIVFPD